MTDVAEKLDRAPNNPEVGAPRTRELVSPEDDLSEPELEQLAGALAARDRFISVVAHELRNSLAPMSLLAEQFGTLAEGSQPPGKLLMRVAMLTNNLNKLIATVGRIVDVTDLRRGKVQLAPTPTDLVDVVGEVSRDVERDAAAAGSQLIVDSRGPVIGRWDRARVKQIVSDLVGNAIRHGASSRIDLVVRAGPSTGELTVRDHGPGIDAAALPRLFDCFDHAPTRRAGSLGLGLWLVKTLCHAMGGTVSAENCIDGGARFCVVLPRG
jgi:two-component system, OmpR family, sensor kinase